VVMRVQGLQRRKFSPKTWVAQLPQMFGRPQVRQPVPAEIN
jgi:hypothetical protein